MNEWKREWMKKRINEWMNEWKKDEPTNEWMKKIFCLSLRPDPFQSPRQSQD